MSSLSDKDLNKYSKQLDDINKKIIIAEDLIFIENEQEKIIKPGLNNHTLSYLMNKLEKLYNIRDDIKEKLT